MRRSPLLLLLLTALGLADGRADFVKARDTLSKADFASLPPDDREGLFEALGRYDQPDAVKAIAEVSSAYGTFLSGLEGKLEEIQTKLRPVMERTSLTEVEIEVRKDLLSRQRKVDDSYRRALRSLDVLAKALASFREPKSVQLALSSYPKHATWRVRYLLALAAPDWHKSIADEKLSAAVFAAVKSLRADAEPRVRVASARSMASFQREEAIESLKAFLKDPDWRVRAAAIESLRAAKTGEAVSALLEVMAGETGRLRDDINAALKEMTGQRHEEPEAWAGWWKSVGQRIPPPGTIEGEPPPKPAYVDAHGPNFYGIPTRSARICFVIDMSGSMEHPVDPLKQRAAVTGRKDGPEGPAAGRTRWEVARNELKRAVTRLNAKQNFTVIFFSNAVKLWRAEMVPATPENKKKLEDEVDLINPRGATFTLGAMREAFSLAGAFKSASATSREGGGVDTIFLLSDGAPTDAEMTEEAKLMDPGIILQSVREWNKDLRITIHTIAVDIMDNYFLRTLAAENRGQFVERKG